MKIEEMDILLREFYTKNKEYKGSGYARRLIQQAKTEWEKTSKELLKKAIILIKGWHNMGIPDNDLAEKTWKIYYEHAPEMKEIREYLNAPEP